MDEAIAAIKAELVELGASMRQMRLELAELNVHIESVRVELGLQPPNALPEEEKAGDEEKEAARAIEEAISVTPEEPEPVEVIAVVPTPAESPTPAAESPARPVSRWTAWSNYWSEASDTFWGLMEDLWGWLSSSAATLWRGLSSGAALLGRLGAALLALLWRGLKAYAALWWRLWQTLYALAQWLWGLPSAVVSTLAHLWRWRWLYLPLALAGGLLFKWVWDDPQQRLLGPLGRGWQRLLNGLDRPPVVPTTPQPSNPSNTPTSRLRVETLRGLLYWYSKNGA